MKKILVLTTNRADYSKLEQVINILYKNKKIQLYTVVSGSHLLTDYGSTYKNIKYPIYKKINSLIQSEDLKMMSESVGFALIKYSSILEEIEPNYVILHGDRFDILSMSNACLLMNIPIIHIEGGETSGCIDNKIRDIVSISSKYHIVSNNNAKQKLTRLLNTDKNIFNFGCPIIDKYVSFKMTQELWDICKKKVIGKTGLNLEPKKYIVMIFHVDSINREESEEQFKKLFLLLKETNKQIICFYPNIDSITKDLVRFMDKRSYPIDKNIILLKNIESYTFITLLYNCGLFIGNSSALVREAPVLNIPTILIGKRQKNRVLYKSTNYFEKIDKEKLCNHIDNVFGKKIESEYVYGNGTFCNKFIKFIDKL